jgi:hypothetical protein
MQNGMSESGNKIVKNAEIVIFAKRWGRRLNAHSADGSDTNKSFPGQTGHERSGHRSNLDGQSP